MRENGFTLVEVLVALTVSSILGIVLLGGLQIAEQRRLSVSLRTAALDVAERELATRAALPHREGNWSGRADGFTWEVTEQTQLSDSRARAALDTIELVAFDENGERLLSLHRSALRPYPED